MKSSIGTHRYLWFSPVPSAVHYFPPYPILFLHHCRRYLKPSSERFYAPPATFSYLSDQLTSSVDFDLTEVEVIMEVNLHDELICEEACMQCKACRQWLPDPQHLDTSGYIRNISAFSVRAYCCVLCSICNFCIVQLSFYLPVVQLFYLVSLSHMYIIMCVHHHHHHNFRLSLKLHCNWFYRHVSGACPLSLMFK